ncbi:hypothetical protein GCM10011389_22940 [Pontibacillus salipaludis]|uniref:Uncharacterized protein n=1 Tax=Pontibacillus salipaludis TaxID=1697394 RepID=A0ABQ1Q5P3_9BACI|nr:hypothetical protein GCM10011389_22940 [Pontibacillus salipaludis]
MSRSCIECGHHLICDLFTVGAGEGIDLVIEELVKGKVKSYILSSNSE